MLLRLAANVPVFLGVHRDYPVLLYAQQPVRRDMDMLLVVQSAVGSLANRVAVTMKPL